MSVTLKINQIDVRVTTLPSVRPEWAPLLHIDISDVLVQSTNSNWEVNIKLNPILC